MILVDEFGTQYEVEKQLSSGAQGTVWVVDNYEKVVIKTKLSLTSDDKNGLPVFSDDEYDKYAAKINRIKALCSLNNVDCVAVPLSVLARPTCGFVMRFMEKMEKIDAQMRHSTSEKKDDENYISMVGKNGSILKKYKVLKNLARTLSTLHAHGLVYCDLSPSNVYISKEPESYEAWLIDVDNIRYSGNGRKAIGTPLYRAPEIYNGSVKSNTFQSDMYSFALLAYQYLTGARPFETGSEKSDSDDDFADDVLEQSDEAIESGGVDYVLENKHGLPSFGIPPKYVFSESIEKLFYRTFCKKGRKCPMSRPTAHEWYCALDDSINLISKCSNDHYHFGTHCEWCSSTGKTNNNTYLVLRTRTPIEPHFVGNEWDEDETKLELRPYSEKSVVISVSSGNGKDYNRFELTPSLFSNNEICAVVTVRKGQFTINFSSLDEIRLKPTSFSWDYRKKADGESFRLIENDKLTKEVELSIAREQQ